MTNFTPEKSKKIALARLDLLNQWKEFRRKSKNKLQEAENFIKYLGVVFISALPSIAINAYVTKEQKKASRVADMLAINEMQDYKKFK